MPLPNMRKPKTREQWGLCVCVCVCIFKRYFNHDNASKISTPHVKNTLHIKIYTQHNFVTLQHYRTVLTYQPAWDFLDFLIFSTFGFWFLISVSCLPADEATTKLHHKLSTQFRQQTAKLLNKGITQFKSAYHQTSLVCYQITLKTRFARLWCV